MKKLKLSLQNIEGAAVLTRQQLKMVLGGSGEGKAEFKCYCYGDEGNSWTQTFENTAEMVTVLNTCPSGGSCSQTGVIIPDIA